MMNYRRIRVQEKELDFERFKQILVKEWLRDWPNRLTAARIASIPLLLLLFPWNFEFLKTLCAIIFALAAISDYLDGFLARRYNQVSRMGAFLAPVAEKMLTATGLILLSFSQTLPPLMA